MSLGVNQWDVSKEQSRANLSLGKTKLCKKGEIHILHGPAVKGNIKLIKS